jgi:hypothetical protein
MALSKITVSDHALRASNTLLWGVCYSTSVSKALIADVGANRYVGQTSLIRPEKHVAYPEFRCSSPFLTRLEMMRAYPTQLIRYKILRFEAFFAIQSLIEQKLG